MLIWFCCFILLVFVVRHSFNSENDFWSSSFSFSAFFFVCFVFIVILPVCWQCNVNFRMTTRKKGSEEWTQRNRFKMFMVHIKYDVWNSILASNKMQPIHYRLSSRSTHNLVIDQCYGWRFTLRPKDFIRRIDFKINIPPPRAHTRTHTIYDGTIRSHRWNDMPVYNILKTTYSYTSKQTKTTK